MDERLKFVARLLDGEKMAVLCRAFGISRKTGYNIFNRYKDDGLEALTDRSRRPVRYANQLPDQIERTIVATKKDKPHWGARKIRELLIRRLAGDVRIPSKSTVHAVLDRHGLVKRARQRRRFKAEGTQLSQAAVPNALWCTDPRVKPEGMLQRRVPAGRRPLLLPPDGHRPGLALPARLRSARIDEGRPGHRGLHPPVQGTRPACRYKVTTSLAVRDALLAGFGLSLIPRIYVEKDIAEGRLTTALDDWTPVETSIYVVYPSRQYVLPKVRAFVDFLVDEMQEEA